MVVENGNYCHCCAFRQAQGYFAELIDKLVQMRSRSGCISTVNNIIDKYY